MNKLKIFFDASSICWGIAGIPVYTRQVARFLAQHPEIEFHTGLKSLNPASHKNYQSQLKKLVGNNVNYHKIFLPGRLGWQLPLIHPIMSFDSAQYDILHYPSHVAPCFVPPSDFGNVILTVHDMFLWHKEYAFDNQKAAEKIKKALPTQTEKAKAIFTISEFSRQEIHRYLGIPLEKIYTVPIATQWSNIDFMPSDVLLKNSLSARSYFLAVSTLLPHKNYITLFTAFKKYQQSTNYAGEKLVVVGKRKEQFKDICDALDTTPNVIHLQNIPENDLRTLYENCKGFFLVSKLEGFGIPLLEAMSCKVPACYGQGSSMDEIGRDAAYGVNPDDIDKIAETFAVFSAGGKEVQQRVEQAYAISQEYSYEKTVETYVKIYKKLLNKSS